MWVDKTVNGAYMIALDKYFSDHRGRYVETYNRAALAEYGIDVEFVQDDISISHENVLRGFHGDQETWKLISCPYGSIYVATVSPEGLACGVRLDTLRCQLLVPPRYGLAHLVLSESAIFAYKQSTYYHPESQFTIPWNHPAIDVAWPVRGEPILSDRDANVEVKPLGEYWI
jgi:dTDP-4-dehydrorhamnose 3,5-epimerase